MNDTANELQEALSEASDLAESLDNQDFSEQRQSVEEFTSKMSDVVELERKLYSNIFDATSAKARIARFLKANQRQAVTTEQISRVAGINDYTRRIRELRNENGFIIATSRTNAELDPNEYVLVEVRDTTKKNRLSSKRRDEYLEKQPCCEKCGFDPREHNSDDVDGNRYLEVDHIEPYENFDSSAEANRDENLQTLCNVCHNAKGASNGRWT